MDVNPVPIDAVEDDPTRPWKAIATTAGTFVALFASAWIADSDPFTAKEAASALIGAGIGSGVLGGITFAVPNPKRLRR